MASKPPPRIKRKLPPSDLALIRRYMNRPRPIPTPWGVWGDPERGLLPPLPTNAFQPERFGHAFGRSGWAYGQGGKFEGEPTRRHGIHNWDPRLSFTPEGRV